MATTATINGEFTKEDGNEYVDPTVTGANFEKVSKLYDRGNVLATGVEVCERQFATGTTSPASGELWLSYFTSHRGSASGGVITKIRSYIGGTAGSGLTIGRIGLYTVDSLTGDLTLVASAPNGAATWTGTYTSVDHTLSASYTLSVGARYAVGVVFVGTTPPTLVQMNGSSDWSLNAAPPRLCGKLTSQTDLPSSVTEASIGTTAGAPYAILIP